MTPHLDMEAATTPGAAGPAAQAPPDELWSGLPSSNLYKQKRLTGWRDVPEATPEGAVPECRARLLEGERCPELAAFLEARGRCFDAVMLGAYHLVLQWLLDELESVIGCFLVRDGGPDASPGPAARATLRPSYVYAEDDDPVHDLLEDVERQLLGGRALEVDLREPASWATRRTPVFLYVGVHGRVEPGAPHLLAARLPERGVVVAASDAPAQAASVTIPGAVSEAIRIQDFQRRYDRALSAVLAGDCPRVGDVKERLGEGAQVPYRQLEEMQRRLIALWASVLGIAEDTLTESSNYYDVGGTSLNAFKLVNRVRAELQRDISIWEIIENPTIQELSRVLLRD